MFRYKEQNRKNYQMTLYGKQLPMDVLIWKIHWILALEWKLLILEKSGCIYRFFISATNQSSEAMKKLETLVPNDFRQVQSSRLKPWPKKSRWQFWRKLEHKHRESQILSAKFGLLNPPQIKTPNQSTKAGTLMRNTLWQVEKYRFKLRWKKSCQQFWRN